MTVVKVTGGDDTPDEELPPPLVDEAPATGALPGSVFAAIEAEVDAEIQEDDKVFPVGKIAGLYARYRVLDDDEREEQQQKLKQIAKERKRTGQDPAGTDQQLDAAALLLAKACVELLLERDGKKVPIHEIAAETLGDDAPGPLRYDVSSMSLIMPKRLAKLEAKIGRRPTSVDVCREMHRWGVGENHQPLLTYSRLLNLWMTGVSSEALSDTLDEGN